MVKSVRFFLFLMIVMIPANMAQANMTITPFIAYFEGKERYTDVFLLNTSDKTRSYALEWMYHKMEEGTGEYIALDGPTTEFDLSKHTVFTPRRVTLGPKETQKVRIGLRIKGERPGPGDYRAHLRIRETTDLAPQIAEAESKVPIDPETGERPALVNIAVRVGFSIPVVYRVGEFAGQLKISDLELGTDPERGKLTAKLKLSKTDMDYGFYGDIYVYHNDKLIGNVSNANLFPEINMRDFEFVLRTNSVQKGVIRVDYVNTVGSDKDKVIASKSFPIQ